MGSSWRVLLTLPQHNRYITACAFSGDSKFLATCSESHTNMWRLGLEEEKPEEEEEGEDEVPSEFYCPITYDLMQDPVKCSDGFTYEELAIREWLLTRRNTSPMTNLELEVIHLTADLDLKKRIQEYKRGM